MLRVKLKQKPLTKGEIEKLKRNGWSHSDKGKRGGLHDLYKDRKGNIYQKPKGGLGYGEPINENIRNLTIIGAVGTGIYKLFDLGSKYFSQRIGPLIIMPFYIDGATNKQQQIMY